MITLHKGFLDLQNFNAKDSYDKPPYYIVSDAESSDLILYLRALDFFYHDFMREMGF